MRGLLAALLLLSAGPLFAVDTGKADGRAVVNGKTVRFKYAYAYTTGDQSVTVLVTDRALWSWDDPRKPVPRRVQAVRVTFEADGRTEVTQILVQLNDGTFVVDHPKVGMNLNIDEDAIEGSISLPSTSIPASHATVRVRIAFNAEYSK
jgi:hypothetical protein